MYEVFATLALGTAFSDVLSVHNGLSVDFVGVVHLAHEKTHRMASPDLPWMLLRRMYSHPLLTISCLDISCFRRITESSGLKVTRLKSVRPTFLSLVASAAALQVFLSFLAGKPDATGSASSTTFVCEYSILPPAPSSVA